MTEPINPFSVFLEHAVSTNELYNSYIDAGFTTEQAFSLTTIVLNYVMGIIAFGSPGGRAF